MLETSGKLFRVAPSLGSRLEELGIPPDVVLRRSGLPPGLFEQPRILLNTEDFFGLWTGIGALSADPVVGLRLGSETQIDRYDPIAIAALLARDLGDSLDRIARYKQLTCPEEVEVARSATETCVRFRWTLAKEAEPAVLVDLCFAWVMTIARHGTGEPLIPLRVDLERRAKHRRVFEQFFGCAVRFEAGRNAIVFRSDDLDRPYKTHNADLLAMIAPALEEELRQREKAESIEDRVRTIVQQRLAGRRPTVHDVAREMRMSARTLQRRLLECGSSFQQVVEEARHKLARHYLVHSPLELNETAYLLGYEDTNSFVRAFHSWEGVPPAHWRLAQQRQRTASGAGGRRRSA